MAPTEKVVIFKVNKEEYAIQVEHVISIEKTSQVTPIPQLPNYVKGIVKVREELVPVIDLKNVLYKTDEVINDVTRFIVVKTDQLQVALLVSDAKELLEIESGHIKQVGFIGYEKTAFFSGVIQLTNRLITLIEPNQLVSSLEGIKEIYEYMEDRYLNETEV
ncbi:chemotaxis protein CheW [Bacillus kwashiorkori]|uniref:chemotaxis protein CheW n=1 Tax=Bacillus kwashiorkori TaxID=1522318 RepID=UPI000782A565|nr:chemotaxis protein CheW [Bacillus kwashiorkori]